MDIVYTLGISSLWDEVCHMPVGGVWWLNVDRYADAVSLMNQTLESQAQDSKGVSTASSLRNTPEAGSKIAR